MIDEIIKYLRAEAKEGFDAALTCEEVKLLLAYIDGLRTSLPVG